MARPSKTPPLPVSVRRRKEREAKERRMKILLFIGAIIIVFGGASLIWQLTLHRNSWSARPITAYESEAEDKLNIGAVSFLSPTQTPTTSATPLPPTATLTPTETVTPTITATMTITPTPKLRPRRTVEGSVSDLLALAEKTQEAIHQQQSAGTAVPQEWFELSGVPAALDPSLIYENAECTWMGVAGILTDKRAEPQIGYYIQIGLNDGSVLETLSGLYPNYGESGYELTIARPVQSFDTPIWIQVLNQSRIPVSEKFYFRPSSQCGKSLTVIDFQRIR